MPELKLLLETLKYHVPDATIVDCTLGQIDGVQLLPKRYWCHVIKHRASFVRRRLESLFIDKSCTMKIGPNLLVLCMCPSPLVASWDVDVLAQDFTNPK